MHILRVNLQLNISKGVGSKVRVNAICPAASYTPMLEGGFAGNPDTFQALHKAHPSGRIGNPEEVAYLLVAEAPSLPQWHLPRPRRGGWTTVRPSLTILEI